VLFSAFLYSDGVSQDAEGVLRIKAKALKPRNGELSLLWEDGMSEADVWGVAVCVEGKRNDGLKKTGASEIKIKCRGRLRGDEIEAPLSVTEVDADCFPSGRHWNLVGWSTHADEGVRKQNDLVLQLKLGKQLEKDIIER
jgi:hypothetical protein